MTGRPLAFEPLARAALNELVYQRLKQTLLTGRIEPGVTLTLRELADQLATSVVSARAAVKRLAAEHAFDLRPGRGIRIPPLEPETAAELWRLRALLEGDACAQAAARATTLELQRIGTLCAEVATLGRAGDLLGMLAADSAFQFAIYEAARAPLALRFIEALCIKSMPYCAAAMRRMLREHPPYFEATWRDRAALLDALGRRDGSAARDIKVRELRKLQALVADSEERFQ